MRVAGTVQSQKPKNSYIAVGHSISPYISTYVWSPSGFGTKFSDPTALPGTTGKAIKFSNQGKYIGLGMNFGSNAYKFYPWTSAGFGTNISATTAATSGNGVKWSPDDNNVIFTSNSSPYFFAHPWTSAGLGTVYANPATLQSSDGSYVTWSNTQSGIISTLRMSPYVQGWQWSNGFGTKFANPSSLPNSSANGVDFSPFNNSKFVMSGFYPTVYNYSDSTGFGTKTYNFPGGARGASFHPSTNYVLFGNSASPYIQAHRYTGTDIGTVYANPSVLPTGVSSNAGGNQVSFSQNGYQAAIAHDASPYVTTYAWDDAGFGTKFSNPATLPTGTGNGVTIFN